MIVDPKKVVENNWLMICEHSKIQQSGIDVSLHLLHEVCNIDGIHVKLQTVNLAMPLLPHHSYDFTCHEYIEVPLDCAALVIVRSSLNRRGAFITTGLYDNGFKGYVGGILHTTLPLKLEVNQRIAQVVFIRSEAMAQYDGQYQGGPHGTNS